MTFRVINGSIVPVNMPLPDAQDAVVKKHESFKDVFEREINRVNGLKISGHAMDRLRQRNIELNTADIKKLSDAIEKADSKGARESLLLYKDTAFIASIKNRTIITAIDSSSAKDNVFTNIDSAVIIS